MWIWFFVNAIGYCMGIGGCCSSECTYKLNERYFTGRYEISNPECFYEIWMALWPRDFVRFTVGCPCPFCMFWRRERPLFCKRDFKVLFPEWQSVNFDENLFFFSLGRNWHCFNIGSYNGFASIRQHSIFLTRNQWRPGLTEAYMCHLVPLS